MAVTKIIPIRVTIERSVDYICNPEKTKDGFYIHSEHCTPQTAALTFQHHLNQARSGGNTIGRHLIQSFAPGEVTPETAHEIGKKLAEEILGGQYAYVMSTHVDRDHIHNHFVWCSVNVGTHKKYRSNKGSYHEIRDASERIVRNSVCLLSCRRVSAKATLSIKLISKGQAGNQNLRRQLTLLFPVQPIMMISSAVWSCQAMKLKGANIFRFVLQSNSDLFVPRPWVQAILRML